MLMAAPPACPTTHPAAASGNLQFECPSSQQQLLVWKTRPKQCVLRVLCCRRRLTRPRPPAPTGLLPSVPSFTLTSADLTEQGRVPDIFTGIHLRRIYAS